MGGGAYKTRLGGLFSVIVSLLSFLNLVSLIADDINHAKMQTGTQKLIYRPFGEPAFNLDDQQTDLVTLSLGDDLPVNIGRFRLFQTNSWFTYTETILQESLG